MDDIKDTLLPDCMLPDGAEPCVGYIQLLEVSGRQQAELEKECKRLWAILDDISTAGDMFKPEINGYFKYINKMCSERDGLFTSDGYSITRTIRSE